MKETEQLEKQIERLERRIQVLEHTQRTLDMHISALENSVVFRILRRSGRLFAATRVRIAGWLAGTGMQRIWSSFSGNSKRYAGWVEKEAGDAAPVLTATPRFGILLAAFDTNHGWVEEAVLSILAQSYPHWELRVCAGDFVARRLEHLLTSIIDSDARVRIVPFSAACSFSQALNQAAQSTASEYLIVLSHAGRLAPNALEWFAHEAPADLIYCDEDHIDHKDRRAEPIFKPDWSPDLLLSCMYFGHLMASSRAAWERAGCFREGFDHARNHDLALRITDQEASVKHVQRMLYHRRQEKSGASEAKASHRDGQTAVRDALRRRHAPADVEDGIKPCIYQLRWRPEGESRATVVICSRSAHLLDRCLESLRATTYEHREIIVVQHLSEDSARVQAVIERHRARRVAYSGGFHFAAMNNLGAQAATGNVLVFLNDDTQPLDGSWLERLVGQIERPGVGVAGARLIYPSGTLQHAGVALGVSDGCGHVGRGVVSCPHWPWLQMTRDVAAVTGACLAISASLFRKLGGFAERFPVNYSDIDLCLRARDSGYRVVCDTGAVLRHDECQTRQRGIVTLEERELWFDRWGDLIDAGDPFYSPHLTREREDLSLRAGSGS